MDVGQQRQVGLEVCAKELGFSPHHSGKPLPNLMVRKDRMKLSSRKDDNGLRRELLLGVLRTS